MKISIQKHRKHPIWKFYDENKLYLGQILGDFKNKESKDTMKSLAKDIVRVLDDKLLDKYTKEEASDGSITIFTVKDNIRVASFENSFSEIAIAISDNIK